MEGIIEWNNGMEWMDGDRNGAGYLPNSETNYETTIKGLAPILKLFKQK